MNKIIGIPIANTWCKGEGWGYRGKRWIDSVKPRRDGDKESEREKERKVENGKEKEGGGEEMSGKAAGIRDRERKGSGVEKKFEMHL